MTRPQGRASPPLPAPSPDKPRLEGACPAVNHLADSGLTPRWQCGAEHSDRLPEILVCQAPPPGPPHLAPARPSSFVPMISLFTSFPPGASSPAGPASQTSAFGKYPPEAPGSACGPHLQTLQGQPWRERPSGRAGRWRKEMTEEKSGKGLSFCGSQSKLYATL